MIAIKKIFIIVLQFAFFISAAFSFSIPSTYSTDSLDERRLGNKILRSIWNSNTVVKDVESQIYIKELGQDLVSRASQPNRNYNFFLLHDDTVNAFASWNGYVGIHDALVLFSENESELAAIIAHEIAHISQEHLRRYQEKLKSQEILFIGGLLTSILVKDGKLTEAIASTTIANDMQNQINYTKEHEIEADNFAAKIISETKFKMDGLGSFFLRMPDDSKDYFKTHPMNTQRIANSKSRASKFPRNYQDTFGYQTLKARLSIINKIKTNLDNLNIKLYSSAYKNLIDMNFLEAKKFIDKLIEVNQSYHSLILAGRVYGKLKDLDKSVFYFKNAEKIKNNEVLKYYLAKTFLENDHPKDAVRVLKNYVKISEVSVSTYELLANAHLKLDEIDRYHFYIGKSKFLKGNYLGSIEHFKFAKSLAFDKDFSEVIDYELSQAEENYEILVLTN